MVRITIVIALINKLLSATLIVDGLRTLFNPRILQPATTFYKSSDLRTPKMSSSASYHWKFTPDQLNLASRFADVFGGPQHKDAELMKKMRNKKAAEPQKPRVTDENWE